MTHVLPLRGPFADTDASGRIHSASVYRRVEVAEHDLPTRLGISDATVYPRRAARVGFGPPSAPGTRWTSDSAPLPQVLRPALDTAGAVREG